MKKSLIKCLARSNGGDLQKAMRTLQQRKRDIEKHSYEYAFHEYSFGKKIRYEEEN
jgi:hypothetical protein